MNRLALLLVLSCATAALAGPPKKLSRSAACQKRFAALCEVVQRCSTGADDLGGASCSAIEPGCDALTGEASYEAKAVDECVAGLKKLTCATKADPNDDAAMDFEAKVAACQKLVTADARASRTAASAPTATR